MPTTVYGKSHNIFPSAPNARNIHITREHPFGAAKWVVYNTVNPQQAYGAGDCPALTAHPPYAIVTIPANAQFTVQSLEANIIVSNY